MQTAITHRVPARGPAFQGHMLLRIGFVVVVWLAGIIVNLLTANPPEYYDIALRDIGLLLGALTLNRLATASGATTIASEGRHTHPMDRAA